MTDKPYIDTAGTFAGAYKPYGERIALALERIADVMEQTAADNPLDAFRAMMADGDTGLYLPPVPDPPDRSGFAPPPPPAADPAAVPTGWEQAGHALRVRLPDPDYFLMFDDSDEAPYFRLWLAGPGAELRPLSWRDE